MLCSYPVLTEYFILVVFQGNCTEVMECKKFCKEKKAVFLSSIYAPLNNSKHQGCVSGVAVCLSFLSGLAFMGRS